MTGQVKENLLLFKSEFVDSGFPYVSVPSQPGFHASHRLYELNLIHQDLTFSQTDYLMLYFSELLNVEKEGTCRSASGAVV